MVKFCKGILGEDILLNIRLPKGEVKNIKNFVDSNRLELNDA